MAAGCMAAALLGGCGSLQKGQAETPQFPEQESLPKEHAG